MIISENNINPILVAVAERIRNNPLHLKTRTWEQDRIVEEDQYYEKQQQQFSNREQGGNRICHDEQKNDRHQDPIEPATKKQRLYILFDEQHFFRLAN